MNKTGRNSIIIFGILIVVVFAIYAFNMDEKIEVNTQETSNSDMLAMPAKYSVIDQNVNYHGKAMGYLAKPSSDSRSFPGVIMIHEWWGLNKEVKDMANNLASQGYVVLAVDLYDGEVADNSDKARELATSVRQSPQPALENMKAAISYLKGNENTEKIASLGWCFGGQQSLQITLNSQDIDATVIYYGNLETDKDKLSVIHHPVLGVFGSEDTSIPVESVNQFKQSLNELGVENDINIYPGVGHAFANPSGANYAPEETKDAWKKTVDFLERNLK